MDCIGKPATCAFDDLLLVWVFGDPLQFLRPLQFFYLRFHFCRRTQGRHLMRCNYPQGRVHARENCAFSFHVGVKALDDVLGDSRIKFAVFALDHIDKPGLHRPRRVGTRRVSHSGPGVRSLSFPRQMRRARISNRLPSPYSSPAGHIFRVLRVSPGRPAFS